MATLQSLRETDDALRHRLSEFVVSWEALATALQQNDLSVATLDSVASALSSVCDRSSWQVCGTAWLQKAEEMNWVSLRDLAAHRVQKRLQTRCGLGAKVTSAMYAATRLVNFSSGPAKSTCRWLSNLQEELLDMQAMLVDNGSLLLSMWHRICKERAWTEDSDTTAAARAGYIHNLPRAQLVLQLGEQVNLMRWLSSPRGEEEKRAFWTESCFILLALPVQHGRFGVTSPSSSRSPHRPVRAKRLLGPLRQPPRKHVRTACQICMLSFSISCTYA